MFTEYTERNEAELYSELTDLMSARMDQLYGRSDRALRDTHAKSHASVKAHLEIFDINEAAIKRTLAERTSLPARLINGISIRQGLFSRPGRFPVWLRFANGRPDVNPDSTSDTRSMSVKIIGVDGDVILNDGDRFGRAAAKFEEMGVSAVLVNCLPPDLIHGFTTWMRQFTNLPIGAYPNWGRYLRYEWDWSSCPPPEEFVAHAQKWAAEGMQIIGGCCGVRPVEIRGLVEAFS